MAKSWTNVRIQILGMPIKRPENAMVAPLVLVFGPLGETSYKHPLKNFQQNKNMTNVFSYKFSFNINVQSFFK